MVKKGEYTEKVETIKKGILNKVDFVTKDGEIVEIDDSCLYDIAMDLTNYEEENNLKKYDYIEYLKKLEDFYKYLYEECGGFYFTYYKSIKSDQYTFRFIYLCTYMDYDGYLRYGKSKGLNQLVLKKDLFEILKLSEKETYRTINYLEENNLITVEDNYIKINKKICAKGKIRKSKVVVRMFDDSIRDIYNNSKPKEHKKLSLLIKLLPYIHYNLNVVCKNTSSKDTSLIEPFSVSELSKSLGYSTNQKFKKGLMDIKYNGEPVIMIAKIANKDMIVVNPRVYYKGNNKSDMIGIIRLFEIV